MERIHSTSIPGRQNHGLFAFLRRLFSPTRRPADSPAALTLPTTMRPEDPNAYWMGQGYNVFGGAVVSIDNLLSPVIEKAAEAIDIIPATHVESHQFTCETATELQEHFDSTVGLEGSYGGFSGTLKAKYGVSTSQSGSFGYGWSQEQANINLIRFRFNPSYDMLCEEARNLPTTYDKRTESIFYRFFMKYGTHYVRQITTGGRIDMYTRWDKRHQFTEQTVEASITAQYKAVLGSTAATVDANWRKVDEAWFRDSSTDLTADGGDVTRLIQGPLHDGAWITPEELEAWKRSLSAMPAVTGLKLAPVSDLFQDGRHDDQYRAIREALEYFLGNVITITSIRDVHRADLFIGPGGGKTIDFPDPGANGTPSIFILNRRELSVRSSYYFDDRADAWKDTASGNPIAIQKLIEQFRNIDTFLVYASDQTNVDWEYPPQVKELITAAQPDDFLGGYRALRHVVADNESHRDLCLLHNSLYSFISLGTQANTRVGEDTFLYTGRGTVSSRSKLTLVVPVRFDEVDQRWYIPLF